AGVLQNPQGHRRVWLRQYNLKLGPQRTRHAAPFREAGASRLQPPLGLGRQHNAVTRHKLEQAQNRLWIALQPRGIAQEYAFAGNREFGIRYSRPYIAQVAEERGLGFLGGVQRTLGFAK